MISKGWLSPSKKQNISYQWKLLEIQTDFNKLKSYCAPAIQSWVRGGECRGCWSPCPWSCTAGGRTCTEPPCLRSRWLCSWWKRWWSRSRMLSFWKGLKMNTVFSQYLIFHFELKFQWVEQEYSVFITFPYYFLFFWRLSWSQLEPNPGQRCSSLKHWEVWNFQECLNF